MLHPESLRAFADWLNVKARDETLSTRDQQMMTFFAEWVDQAIGDGENGSTVLDARLHKSLKERLLRHAAARR